jgi:type IV secretion system protein VirD4
MQQTIKTPPVPPRPRTQATVQQKAQTGYNFPNADSFTGAAIHLLGWAFSWWIAYKLLQWFLRIFGINLNLFSLFKGRKQNVDTEKGSAHWAARREIRHLLKKASKPPDAGELLIGEYLETSWLPWRLRSKNFVLNRNLTSRHVLIAAPTGAGKSVTLFLPNLVFPSRQSALITDVKSELWNLASGFQTNPVRFAPMERETASFNWIPLCKDFRTAARCAEAIAYAQGMPKSDPYWINGELRILTAIFSHVAHTDEPFPTHAYELLNTDVDILADILRNSPSETARRAAVKFAKAKDEHKNSFTDSAANKMTWMEDPNIRRFTSSTKIPFDFGSLRHKPTQVFWCLKQTDVNGLKGLTTLFFNLAILQLLDESGKIPVTFFLDEFANVGRLNNFESDITLLRGQNIAVVAGLQDRSQLNTLYGTSQANTILSQFNNKILLGGLTDETAEMFSKLLGEFTYTDIRTSSGKSSGQGWFSNHSSNESYYTSNRRLMTADELRRLPQGENVLISTNLPPIHLKAVVYTSKQENKAKINDIALEMDAPQYSGDKPKQINAKPVAKGKNKPKPPPPKIDDFIDFADFEEPTVVRKPKQPIKQVEELGSPHFTVEDLHKAKNLKDFFEGTDDEPQ